MSVCRIGFALEFERNENGAMQSIPANFERISSNFFVDVDMMSLSSILEYFLEIYTQQEPISITW